jgi:hypothetical protein
MLADALEQPVDQSGLGQRLAKQSDSWGTWREEFFEVPVSLSMGEPSVILIQLLETIDAEAILALGSLGRSA